MWNSEILVLVRLTLIVPAEGKVVQHLVFWTLYIPTDIITLCSPTSHIQVSMAHFDRHHISDTYRSHSVTAVARSGVLCPPDQMCLHDLHYPWILRGLLPASSRGPCAVVCAYPSVKQKEMAEERGLGCLEFLEWCSTQTHRYHTHHKYNTHSTNIHIVTGYVARGDEKFEWSHHHVRNSDKCFYTYIHTYIHS